MTTATVATGNRTMATVVRPRRSLEELVDRLMAALFSEQPETAPATETPSVAKSVHEARRLRQAGQALDGALAVFAGMDMAKATTREARWAYTEWKQLVKRRSWGCAGGPASSSRSAAWRGCGPWGGLALDRLGERRGVAAALALSAVPAL